MKPPAKPMAPGGVSTFQERSCYCLPLELRQFRLSLETLTVRTVFLPRRISGVSVDCRYFPVMKSDTTQ